MLENVVMKRLIHVHHIHVLMVVLVNQLQHILIHVFAVVSYLNIFIFQYYLN